METTEKTDFERLAEAVNAFTKSIVDVFAPAFDAMVDALNALAERMPGPMFRAARKRRQLREHRERVGARAPWWKRTSPDALPAEETQ